MKPNYLLWLAALGLSSSMVLAEEAPDLISDSCAGCHTLTEPNYDALGIAGRAERKGPPLYFAGNKFRLDWLEAWLQEPTQLRPAGVYPPAHTQTTADGDVIDTSSLEEHAALTKAQAEKVAAYLMTLKPFDERIDAVDYEPGKISVRMGQMNFAKFNNCIGCHQDEPGYGGVSGPELYTAWSRMQPAFLASYISDPVRWDPHTLMSGGNLNDAAVTKLVDYLKVIAEEE